MVEPAITTIYTVGHSTHNINKFIELLQKHSITAIADVRSSPFSRYSPQFNKETLATAMKNVGVEYVFMGQELGARPADPHCYENGQVSFKAIARKNEFKQGMVRLLKGVQDYRIALVCAEKNPLDCHRTVLVCRSLRSYGVTIQHILEDGRLQSQEDVERCLVALFDVNPTLFEQELSWTERVERAYDKQALAIAYTSENEIDQEKAG